MLALTVASVSSDDSVGDGASPPRLVSHTPMQLEIRDVSTSAAGRVGAAAAGLSSRASQAVTLALPAVRCIARTVSTGVASSRMGADGSARCSRRSETVVSFISPSLPDFARCAPLGDAERLGEVLGRELIGVPCGVRAAAWRQAWR